MDSFTKLREETITIVADDESGDSDFEAVPCEVNILLSSSSAGISKTNDTRTDLPSGE